MDTPLAEGQRIAYNFVKPHMALEGQTPSQAAGLKIRGWKNLFETTITNPLATTVKNNR
jgi:hypothetical protein